MAALAFATFVFIFVSNVFATDFSYTLTLPENVQECFNRSKNLTHINHKSAEEACLRAHLTTVVENSVTDEDYNFFKTRFEDTRYGFQGPPTGLRRRSEIRTLSLKDRKAVFDVFRVLYENGILGRFGRVHGDQMFRKHKGRAFLPWHRVFLAAFEEEMRKINPNVSLPYWDYTMDYYIPSPDESVVWSHCFFGNGHEEIISGPFAGWYGGYNIEIKRDIAKGFNECPPSLINNTQIKGLMNFCYYENITTGTERYFSNPFNLEVLHDGVHDWVGGDMGKVKFAAFDPVFWMHHAFIDYIWEQFRLNQQHPNCDNDPETDYPNVNLAQNNNAGHARDDPMQAFEHLRNIDGMWNNWTTGFYSYEPQPQCPKCGNSTYLYCNKSIDSIRFPKGVCVSKQISDCKESRRPAPYPIVNALHRKACSGMFVLVGFKGDGRNMNNTDAENRQILSDAIARASKSSPHPEPKPDTCPCDVSGSSRKYMENSFFFVLAIMFVFN